MASMAADTDADLMHFCWRPRNVPASEPEIDLVMIPTDGNFTPYDAKATGQANAKTNGRICVLKFSSSSQRHIFWLQSKAQGRSGDPAWFSPRDEKIVDIVNRLLQGDNVSNPSAELAAVQNNTDDSRRDEDDDETMEDADQSEERGEQPHGGSGGAGAGATGGDVRDEGEGPRAGGADGARA
jgi:26S proteasome regulatory subunit N13